MRSKSWLWVLLVAAACDGVVGDGASADAGGTHPSDAGRSDAGSMTLDAGQPPADAGAVTTATDAGGVVFDAGEPPSFDAGTPTFDAGSESVDAGTPSFDAGTPTFDAGAPRFDAGTPTYDAGTPTFDAGTGFSIRRADAGTLCTGGQAPLIFTGPTTYLAQCGYIEQPGIYELTADLSDGTDRCIKIQHVSGVKLDCAGHRLQGLAITDSDSFEITRCRFENAQAASVNLTDAGTGFIHDNSVDGGLFSVQFSRDVHGYANDFSSTWQQNHTQNSSVSCNTMSSPTDVTLVAGLIISNYGDHNRFEQNAIDGRWTQVRTPTTEEKGADDGIIISDEHHDRIASNTITRVWDTGIEWVGSIHDVVFEDNTISIAANYGIGGWYWSSVSSCQFINNRMTQTTVAFTFLRSYGLRAATDDYPADTAVHFDHNLFDGNHFSQAVYPNFPVVYAPVYSKMFYFDTLSGTAGETKPGPSDYVLDANVFRNNVFQTDESPIQFGSGAVVPGAIVDEGNNHCPAQAGGPVVCAP